LDAHDYSGDYYFSALFFPDGSLGALNGKGANLDSGGGWYDQNGNLIGLSVAGGENFTVIENLSNPTITAWIRSNIFFPPTLFIQRLGTNISVNWSGTFVLQTSTNIGSGFEDITNATSPYTNSIIGDEKRFFRLRTP
jgi:hypothetical protein